MQSMQETTTINLSKLMNRRQWWTEQEHNCQQNYTDKVAAYYTWPWIDGSLKA